MDDNCDSLTLCHTSDRSNYVRSYRLLDLPLNVQKPWHSEEDAHCVVKLHESVKTLLKDQLSEP